MSTELTSITSTINNHIAVTSFGGGPIRGRCIQLNQSTENGIQCIQLTEDQVKQQIQVMTEWLNK